VGFARHLFHVIRLLLGVVLVFAKLGIGAIIGIIIAVVFFVLLVYFLNRKFFPDAQNRRLLFLLTSWFTFIFHILFIVFLSTIPQNEAGWTFSLALAGILFQLISNFIVLSIILLRESTLPSFTKFGRSHTWALTFAWISGLISTNNFRILNSGAFGLSCFKAPIDKQDEYLLEAFGFIQLVGAIALAIAQVKISLFLQTFSTMAVVSLVLTILLFVVRSVTLCRAITLSIITKHKEANQVELHQLF